MSESSRQNPGAQLVQPASCTADEQLAAIMKGRKGPPVANFTVLQDFGNYGQRLQAYALQRYFMDEFGRTVVTMDVDPRRDGVDTSDNRAFHRFERECMNIVDFRGAPARFLDGFSHIVIGGDQVFRTDMRYSRVVLSAIPELTRRNVFSYGAGASPVRDMLSPLVTRLSRNVIAYGLREDYRTGGVDYVKTIDPVFLLHDRWNGVERNAVYSGGVFTYDARGNHSSLSRTVSDGTCVCDRPYIRRNAVDPRDFLGFIRGSDTVVTSSYHGFCFALMYRVPRIRLTVDDHRTRSLIKTLGVRIENDVVVNYDEVFRNIKAEVRRAHDFIETCLGMGPVDYCCYANDSSVRAASSSGGAAFELARAVIGGGGSVYGGAFSHDFRRVVPACVHSLDEYRSMLSKSKYSFCPLPDIAELKDELGRGKEVMYVGSPCHVMALKRLLGSVPDNLITVDFRCRGYSRPDKLSRFIDSVSAETGQLVSAVDFRSSHGFDTEVTLSDGSLRYYRRFDFFMDTLGMCKKCPMAHGFLSCADLTVGDFWLNRGNKGGYGSEFTPEMGCNIVSVNSKRGEGLWDRVRDRLTVKPVLPAHRRFANAS